MAARPHVIGLDIDGATVWILRDVPASMVTAIIDALKASYDRPTCWVCVMVATKPMDFRMARRSTGRTRVRLQKSTVFIYELTWDDSSP